MAIATVSERTATRPEPPALSASSRVARDSVIVLFGGQVERALGIATALVLRSRWGLAPGQMGVYTGLRLLLDNTNRTSLGVSLGAIQRIPILRAQGNHAEADRLANIAHTTNTLTCVLYAATLVIWGLFRSLIPSGGPFGAEWSWGLAAIGGLALLKRYESFLIVVLRARREFVITTQVDVLEGVVSLVAMTAGVYLLGLSGLLGSIAVVLLSKITFLHHAHHWRFRWAWDWNELWRLMWVGLPILANTAVFAAVMSVDRVVLLNFVADGERAAGLYSVALLGAGWSMDAAGRVVTVLYTHFQTTLGETRDEAAVARQAFAATNAQVPWYAAIGLLVSLAGPAALGWMLPRYAAGLPALRPLLPGMIVLSLAWPARQMLIAVGRPGRLLFATAFGLVATAACALFGASSRGMVGVAWGVSLGFTALAITTTLAAFAPLLGARRALRLVLRMAAAFAPLAAIGIYYS